MMTTAAHPVMSQKPFVAIIAVLGFIMALIAGARLSGFEPESSLPMQAAEETITLKFEDAANGVVLVRDASSGKVIEDFGVGEGAFLRATLRALVNQRRKEGVTTQGDFRLERHNGRQFYLIDEATGRALALNAFGPGNAAVFAAFMSNQKGEGQ
jgi:putative photosynthetic complex assembly protein